MSLPLLGHAWRANRWRLLIVSLALVAWGAVFAFVYESFGAQLREIFEQGILPAQFAQFGGGDLLSLTGATALAYVHPIAIALQLVFAIGFGATAVAGEHERGTLEVLLARPLSRRTAYATLALALVGFSAVTAAALSAGALLGATLTGQTDDLGAANLPIQWLNTALLFWAIGSIALAASVSFDRVAPAVGISLAVVLVSYLFEVLGSIWPDAQGLQPYSLFHYLDTRANLAGLTRVSDLWLLAAVALGGVAYALVVFPRRDLAAPA